MLLTGTNKREMWAISPTCNGIGVVPFLCVLLNGAMYAPKAPTFETFDIVLVRKCINSNVSQQAKCERRYVEGAGVDEAKHLVDVAGVIIFETDQAFKALL